MEQENEPSLESAEANTQAPEALAATPVALDARRSLIRLLRKRLKKFVALASQVRADGNPKIIHDARVWSRRLQQAIDALFPKPRYRTELLFEVGAKPLKAQLKSLADLQDAIGVWHDRQVFHRAIAEALARAEVLLNEMPAVRLLLAQLAKDRSRHANEVEKIFRLALEHARNYQKENSSETHATPTPSAVTEAVIDKT